METLMLQYPPFEPEMEEQWAKVDEAITSVYEALDAFTQWCEEHNLGYERLFYGKNTLDNAACRLESAFEDIDREMKCDKCPGGRDFRENECRFHEVDDYREWNCPYWPMVLIASSEIR